MEQRPRNPLLTVDAIIETEGGVVLIERKNPPFGWAIPGGFVDYGETVEDAVRREAREETGLDIEIVRQFHTYSDPDRDPRHHTVTVMFIASASGIPEAGDDAGKAAIFKRETLPDNIVFDHRQVLEDYFDGRY